MNLVLDPCQQVADALRQAGWPEFMVPIMVAVSRAESGCRAEATCRNCVPGIREHSVGPFQINLLAHPWVDEACARDYLCAARAAFRISSGGTDLTPWTAYKSGRYAQFLGGTERLGHALLEFPSPSYWKAGLAAPASPTLRWSVVGVALVLLLIGLVGLRRRR